MFSHRKKALLVHPSVSVRECVRSLLDELQYEVTTVDGGSDASESLEKDQFDLVLLALGEAKDHGELLSQLTKSDEVPFVALTSSPRNITEHRYFDDCVSISHALADLKRVTSPAFDTSEWDAALTPSDDKYAEKVVHSFLSEVPAFLQQLRQAIDQRDDADLLLTTHAFNALSRFFGPATHMHALAIKFEAIVRALQNCTDEEKDALYKQARWFFDKLEDSAEQFSGELKHALASAQLPASDSSINKWHPFNYDYIEWFVKAGQLPSVKELVLSTIKRAKEQLLPHYRQRFHDRVPDPEDSLEHNELYHFAFSFLEGPSALQNALLKLRQLGKDGDYADEEVDRQIDVMLSELDRIRDAAIRML